MEFSKSAYVLSCLLLWCFSFYGGEALNESELHHHKLKQQDVRLRQDMDPGYVANRPDSPYKIAKRSASNTVDIAMFSDSSAPGKTFSVYVDSTMTRLIVEVKVDRSSPVMLVSKPSGLPGPLPKLNGTASAGTVTAMVDTAITAADYGIWKLTKLDANTWNVKVQGESPLDFSYQFLEGNLIKLPVTGDPIQGKSYTTVITVPEYATIQKVELILEFVTKKSTPANMFPPSDQGGGKYQVAAIKMLDKDFMIGIQGHDKSGHFFRRITVIKPTAMILYVPSFAGVKLYENTKLDIPFSVVNKLSTAQDIDISIKDTQGFAEAPQIISVTLKPGENFTGKFVIKGGLLGVTTSVTITAKPYLGHGKVSHGPSEVRQFTVESKQTTAKPTSATITSTATSISTASVTPKLTTPSSTAPSSTDSSSVLTTKSIAKVSASSTSFSRIAGGKVSTTHRSASVKPVSATSGTSSTARTTSIATTSLQASTSSVTALIDGKVAKSTIPPVPQHVTFSAMPSNSKAVGQLTTTESDVCKDETFSKGEIFAAAIVSGVSAGVLIGVAALVTMGLVFKHSINKGKVSPDKKKQRMLSEHNQLA